MNYRWWLLCLIMLSGNAQSFQASIEIIEQFDDVKLVAFISEVEVKNYPQWHSLTEAPPLSISQAIQSVQKLYKVNNNKLTTGAVKEIELREIPRHKNYWHYLVKIKTETDKKSKYQVYIVLMTGKVIPAMIEVESFK